MSRALDPEIKAMRAVVRAVEPLDEQAQVRVLEWCCARALGLPGFDLGDPQRIARLREALRWIRKESYVNGSVREQIDRLLAETKQAA